MPARVPIVELLAALVIAGGGVLTFLLVRPAPGPRISELQASAVVPVEDAEARAWRALADLSAAPLWGTCLTAGGLVDRWAASIASAAAGVSPRRQLDFLAPRQPFSAELRGGRAVLSAASAARYDPLGDLVGSISAEAFSHALRELRPLLQRALPDDLDGLLSKALGAIANAPEPAAELELSAAGAVYRFADPQLERLSDLEKHLLRVGPRNRALARRKAQELLAALRPLR